jgi:pyruvate dehydrogenase (quinone)
MILGPAAAVPGDRQSAHRKRIATGRLTSSRRDPGSQEHDHDDIESRRTMAETVSDFLVQRLKDWGVQRLYGYSGDGINGILGALNRAGNEPTFIQVRHEESAALMACAHAKFTGTVGVCLATQGPGAIHLLNGLYDARLDHQPVVAIVGDVTQMSGGSRYQQEVDLQTLFKDVAGAFIEVVNAPAQMRHVLDRAMRIALAERTVTCIIVPHNVQTDEMVAEPPHEHGAMHSAIGYTPPRVIPQDAELQRAADVLNAGQRVAMLIGAGALGAATEVQQTAEVLGAGVAKALLGKAALPDDLPFVTGSVGWLGTAASNEMMAQCDTLLMIGSGFPYTEFLPEPGQARGVQIDIDPGALNLRYPMDVGLVGDSAETLRALLPLLEPKQASAWRQQIEQSVRDWHEEATRRALQPADPINPQLLFHELSPRLPDQCILAADSGTSTVWFARYLAIRPGMRASVSGTLATMGCGIPYAIAAKFAYPDRVALALIGDGAMQMSGLTELVTIAKYWREWADPRLIVLVLNNRDVGYVTWEQRAMAGDPRFAVSQELPNVPYAKYAELLGLKGITIERPEDVGPAWDAALASDRPVVIDAIVDADVPTLPPDPDQEILAKVERALASEPSADSVREQLAREGVAS